VACGLLEAAAAGRLILAPNTELATALFDGVERSHVAAGHEIWPTPRIRDFSGWLRDRHVERQLTDAALPRALSDIEERELWRSVILESDRGEALLEPEGAARAARRARRALIEYGIPSSALAEYATEESLALLDWTRRFEERCREFDCVSADQLLASTPTGSLDMVWIESAIWRPVARRWLERNGTAMLLPADPGMAAQPFLVRAASPAAELAAIAEWARDNLRSNPEFRAWICIPDLHLRRAQVQDAFDAVLAPERLSLSARETVASYALAGGTPLSGYAPVRAALDALSAAAGLVSFERFSALLRSPQLQASPADAAAAAVLDLALRDRGPDEAALDDWLRVSEQLVRDGLAGPAALQRLRAFMRTLAGVRGNHPMSRWVSLWVDAFESGPWAERHRWSSSEFQAAERLRELLAALATADGLFGGCSARSAGRILNRAAHDTAFQAQTGVPPIWISGQMMDPWLAYDGIWVTGCSEDRWPPPLDPIPLLPVRLQRQYGIVSAGAELQLQLAEDLQQRWQSRARSSVFSCADPGDGRTTTVSPLLPAAPALESPVALTQPHWRLLAMRAPPFEQLGDERAPPFASPERMRGVATLRAQSQCAFRGFAETRLQARRFDRPVPGFNPRERGEMLHHALESIWQQLRTSAELQAIAPAARAALVSASVALAIAQQCARRDPGARWRRREAPRLEALLGKWLDTEMLREPFAVERLEHGKQVARHGGLEFEVRIDRVDRLPAGGRVLIDYKTGMASADWRGDRPDNPQLPIYALLRPAGLVAVAYGRVNAGECSFVAEAERGGIFKPRGRPSHMEGLANFSELVGVWSQRIERIAAEFAAGNAQVAPTLRACGSCHLQPLCRVPSALDEGAEHDD
jgi:ATP-dependent helicase/nuclease subunit B